MSQVSTKTYRITLDDRIELGWFEGSKKKTYRIPIVWNERYTEVIGAQTDLYAKPDANTTGVRLYMNVVRISELLWVGGELADPKSDTKQVIGYLRNGENIFEIECFKTNPLGFPPVGFTVSANLVLTYEGSEPQVKPWAEYVVPAVAIVGGTIFGAWIMRR